MKMNQLTNAPETYELTLPIWAGVPLTTGDWSDLDKTQTKALRKLVSLTYAAFSIADRPCFWYIEHNDNDELQYWRNHDLEQFGIGEELCLEMSLRVGSYS